MIKISVVIPTYNCEKFLRKAVESALHFQEVVEVVLVEDGSSDNTFNVCVQLEKEYEKVKLYQHPDGKNNGAGASRNLGVKKAASKYIAFLDADDYYLPNRFDADRKLICINSKIDGVYGAIGTYYYSNDAKEKFKETSQPELLTVNKKISPAELKYALIGMSKIYTGSAFFSLDSLTVKKSLIEKIGFFNEKLRLHQDTDFIIKLAFMGTLVPGIIDTPIGMRMIHGNNRITSKDFGFNSRYLLFSELELWLNNNIIGEEKVKRFICKEKKVYNLLRKGNKLYKLSRLIKLFKSEPYLFYIDREFNHLVKGILGNSILIKIFIGLKKIVFRAIFEKRIQRWCEYIYQ